MLPAGRLEADQTVLLSSTPEDWGNCRPKHVEMIGIINEPLSLLLVGCLYYLYQWSIVKQISKTY